MENKIKILYINACSIKNKMDEIELLINEENIDILVVTETWVQKNEEKFYNFSDFDAVYAARIRRGGGLGIFINKKFKFEVIEKIETEISYIAIKIICTDLVICGIYRPPSVSTELFLNFLDEKLENLNTSVCDCYLLADMNINILINSKYSKRLLDIYNSNNFKLYNKKITTRDTNSSATLIDHIITNSSRNVELSFQESPLSDHKLQFFNIYYQTVLNKLKYKIINQTKYEINKLKTKLNGLECKKHYFKDPNLFYNEILKIFEECTYHINFKVKENSKPWFTKELTSMVKIRNKHYKKKKENPENEYYKEIYDNYNKLLKKKIRTVKYTFYKEQFLTGNKKIIWKNINFIVTNSAKKKNPQLITL